MLRPILWGGLLFSLLGVMKIQRNLVIFFQSHDNNLYKINSYNSDSKGCLIYTTSFKKLLFNWIFKNELTLALPLFLSHVRARARARARTHTHTQNTITNYRSISPSSGKPNLGLHMWYLSRK